MSLLYPNRSIAKHLWAMASKPVLIVSDMMRRQLVLHGWAPPDVREALDRRLHEGERELSFWRAEAERLGVTLADSEHWRDLYFAELNVTVAQRDAAEATLKAHAASAGAEVKR